jgi:RNA polymerase sigma-70 factor (ECF subfamily)
MPENVYNETELLLRIKAGEEAAFNEIVDHYSQLIYDVAYAYLKAIQPAEDITQEIFYKLWTGRAKLGEVSNLRGYLFILTRNEVLDGLRKKGPRYPVSAYLENTLASTDGQPEETLALREFQSILQKAIQLLPPQQKMAYQLSREAGMSHDAIATQMNLSKNTVKNHIVAALGFIRQYIKENGHAGLLLLLLLLF